MDMATTPISTRVLLSQIISLVGYSILCVFSVALIGYLRFNRLAALRGNDQASRKVILPAFEPLLWILAAVAGVYVIFFIVALTIKLYTSKIPSLHGEMIYAGRQFIFVLGLVFICHKSVSVPALRRAVIQSILLAWYTVPIVWALTQYAPDRTTLLFVVKVTARLLLLVFVVCVCFVRPPVGRASPVTLRTHGAYIIVYHVLIILNGITQQQAPESSTHSALTYIVLTWSSFCPFVIWRLLRADTEYWRGMGKRIWSRQPMDLPCSQTQLDEEILSSGIHDLIELHRKFLIDFAHLALAQKIGVGSSASVFCGRLHQRTLVAVKVYTPRRFNEEVVAEFSHEAALCASLSHPNVVKFHGMCVCPPTIGLVFELCQGSLEDVLSVQAETCAARRATRSIVTTGEDGADSSSLGHQQMLLNVAYMLDCARAVAYVHGFSPPLLHRDVKTANFLVDKDNNVKLTDFGDSRRLPRDLPSKGRSEVGHASVATLDSSFVSSPNANTLAHPQIKMTVTGTVCYMAPEMINSRTGLATYGEAADVYSLAITFWDILFPGREKYPLTNNNPLRIFEGVLHGCRPPLDASNESGKVICPRLRDMITRAWHPDPAARLTMPQIVRELECIQEELLAVLAQNLTDDFDRLRSQSSITPVEKCFTGAFLVERLEKLQATDSPGEGVRLGCALMDAGFLHHLRHAQGFEPSTATYFFDHSNISLCEPVAMLEECAETSPESDADTYPPQSCRAQSPTAPSMKSTASKRTNLFSQLASSFMPSGGQGSHSTSEASEVEECACRTLGQRHTVPIKTTDRRARQGHRQRHRLSRQPSVGLSPSRHAQSVCSSSSSGNGSSRPSQTRWNWRSRNVQENTLRRKLLDEEDDVGDGRMLESSSITRPAA